MGKRVLTDLDDALRYIRRQYFNYDMVVLHEVPHDNSQDLTLEIHLTKVPEFEVYG